MPDRRISNRQPRTDLTRKRALVGVLYHGAQYTVLLHATACAASRNPATRLPARRADRVTCQDDSSPNLVRIGAHHPEQFIELAADWGGDLLDPVRDREQPVGSAGGIRSKIDRFRHAEQFGNPAAIDREAGGRAESSSERRPVCLLGARRSVRHSPVRGAPAAAP
ncbi:MAG: hypothetical protein R2845_02360 [Thermomicrobiales bacterium]